MTTAYEKLREADRKLMRGRCVLNVIAHAELDLLNGARLYDEAVLEQAIYAAMDLVDQGMELVEQVADAEQAEEGQQ